MTPEEILAWFSSEALTADINKLNGIYSRTKSALSACPDEY